MLKNSIISILFLFVLCRGYGQGGFTRSGTVKDTSGTVLSKATLTVYAAGDTLNTLSGQAGGFILHIPACTDFILTVTMKGYQLFRKSYSLEKDKGDGELPPILLTPASTELAPVTVTGTRPVTLKRDTLEFHARAYTVREGSDLDELLKRMPGMEVDMQGNVTINGKKISKLLVDGKEFFGSDVLLAIRNLPADIVDKVQVIDDYGDKARLIGIRTGDAAKVLNIELDPAKRHGQFGETRSGAGSPSLYLASLLVNSFRGEKQVSLHGRLNNTNETAGSPADTYNQGFGFNYADRLNRGWLLGGDYGYSAQQSLVQSNSSQETLMGSGQISQAQQSQTVSGNTNHHAGMNLNHYNADSSLIIRITPFLNEQHSHSNAGNQFLNGQSDSSTSKTVNGSSTLSSISHTLNSGSALLLERIYKHSLRRYSLSGNINYSNSITNGNNLTHAMTLLNTDSTASVQDWRIHTANDNTDLNLAANYYEPLSRTSFLELGGILHRTLTHTLKSTLTPDSLSGLLIPIDSLSNQYTYRLQTNTLHAGWIAQFDRFNLNTTLEGQFGQLSIQSPLKIANNQYHYFELLPNAQFAYAISKFKRISLNYNGSPGQPDLSQLQPVPDYSNPQYPVKGNPGLKPEFTHSFSTQYEQSYFHPNSPYKYYTFSFGLNVSRTQEKIVTNLLHPRTSNTVVQETEFTNANGFHSYGGNYHIDFPPVVRHNLKISMGGSYSNSQSISMVDSIVYRSINASWNQSLNCQYTLLNKLENNLSLNYSRNSQYYPDGSGINSRSATLNGNVSGRVYLYKIWTMAFNYSQTLNSWLNHGLQANPAQLNGFITRQFGKGNKTTIGLAGYDLLNANKGIIQSVSGNSISRNQNNYLGRYFLLSFSMKFNHFK